MDLAKKHRCPFVALLSFGKAEFLKSKRMKNEKNAEFLKIKRKD